MQRFLTLLFVFHVPVFMKQRLPDFQGIFVRRQIVQPLYKSYGPTQTKNLRLRQFADLTRIDANKLLLNHHSACNEVSFCNLSPSCSHSRVSLSRASLVLSMEGIPLINAFIFLNSTLAVSNAACCSIT